MMMSEVRQQTRARLLKRGDDRWWGRFETYIYDQIKPEIWVKKRVYRKYVRPFAYPLFVVLFLLKPRNLLLWWRGRKDNRETEARMYAFDNGGGGNDGNDQ